MLHKYGKFWYAIYTLQRVALEPKLIKSKIQNIANEALKSKQFEMVSQIRPQGRLLSAILFEAFP